jgi:glucose/arabinose dehydrogenase
VREGQQQPRRLAAGAILNIGIIGLGLLAIAGLLLVNLLSGEDPLAVEPLDLAVRLDPVAEGLDAPVLLLGSGDGSGDRFVVEQDGRIMRLLDDGAIDDQPFLDIGERVLVDEHRGLLGLAFHPRYGEDGRFFVAYSRRDDGATSISQFTAPVAGATDPPLVESTERVLLTIPQPFAVHQAGMLAFDLDGMLMVSVGDGGSPSDAPGQGQDRASLLGKLLRLDVDRGWPYATPLDNGFAGDPAARPELHAIGLRDAWRFSVDRETGDLYLADAGEARWEEVNVLPRGTRRGSFGWSEMEGPDCLEDDACEPDAHILPAIAYPHVDAEVAHCRVIGGYAYRGPAGSLPEGTYLYADHCSGTIWGVPAAQLLAGRAQPAVVGQVPTEMGQAVSFGEDDAGELYLLTSTGHVLAISARRPA